MRRWSVVFEFTQSDAAPLVPSLRSTPADPSCASQQAGQTAVSCAEELNPNNPVVVRALKLVRLKLGRPIEGASGHERHAVCGRRYGRRAVRGPAAADPADSGARPRAGPDPGDGGA